MKLDAKKAHESLLIADSILEEIQARHRIYHGELEALKKHLKLLHKYFDLETSK